MRKYYIMYNIGKAKYVVNFHDGIKKHNDGSNFYDIAMFKSKKAMNTFIAGLMQKAYTYRNGLQPL